MLISKADIKIYVPRFSANTLDDVFTAHVLNVKSYKLVELFDPVLIADLAALTAGTDKPQLRAFWETYVKPYFIWEFYADFMTQHGIEITPGGAFNLISDNHQAISKGDRHLIIEDARAKAQYCRKVMMNRYFDTSLTFDTKVYKAVQITAKPYTSGITAIDTSYGVRSKTESNYNNNGPFNKY